MAAKKKAKKAAPKAAKKAAPKKKAAAKAAAKKPAARRAAAKPAPRPAKPKGPRMIHWEIQSQQPTVLHEFYAKAFGWNVDANNPMNYGMVASAGEGGIAGGIGGSPAPGSRVVVYAEVDDINAQLAAIELLGGRTMMPRTDIGPVIMAIFTDPEGNTMGLVESR
jgi:predicted enzyme related to lactoylglutathione lyase